MKDYFRFVLDSFMEGKSETTIESSLKNHDRYQFLVKERPVLTKKPKDFSSAAKDVVVLTEVLAKASVCNLCRARIDLKAMQIDHDKDKKYGGLGVTQNAQILHPFCNSAYKPHLQRLSEVKI